MFTNASVANECCMNGEPDRADRSSVSSLMTIISHLPFQGHKQLPIINSALTAVIHWGLRSTVDCCQVFYALAELKRWCVALFPAAQAKHLSIHLTLPNEVFFLFLVFGFFFFLNKKTGILSKALKVILFLLLPKVLIS